MREYSFESKWAENAEWNQSVKRFTNIQDAAEAATYWMTVNAENSNYVMVRLCEIKH